MATRAKMGKRRKPQKAAEKVQVAIKKAKIERTDDPIDTNQPDVYAFTDTPKSFQRLFRPKPKFNKDKQPSEAPASKEKGKKNIVEKKSSEGKEWDILPGETFRQFNARIQAAEGQEKKPKEREPLNKTAGQEFAEARGISEKRKKYLKKRDERLKVKKSRLSDEEDAEEYRWDSIGFGERVEAPPHLKAKPKAFKKKQ